MDTANGDEETIPWASQGGERAQRGSSWRGWTPDRGWHTLFRGWPGGITQQAQALYTRARAREGPDWGYEGPPDPLHPVLSSIGEEWTDGVPKGVSGWSGGCDAYLAKEALAEDSIGAHAIAPIGDPDLGQTLGYPHLGPFWDPSWGPYGPMGCSLVEALAHATIRVSPVWRLELWSTLRKGHSVVSRGSQMGSQIGPPDGVSWGSGGVGWPQDLGSEELA